MRSACIQATEAAPAAPVLPKSACGKVLKGALRDRYWARRRREV